MGEVQTSARIQRFFDAENDYCRAAPGDRDIALMLRELDPEVVVDVPASLPHGGTWRGHEGFVALFARVAAHWREFEVVYDTVRWHLLDDRRVLTEGNLRAATVATGELVEMPVISIFTFSAGGVRRLEHYYKDTAAFVCASPRSGGIDEKGTP